MYMNMNAIMAKRPLWSLPGDSHHSGGAQCQQHAGPYCWHRHLPIVVGFALHIYNLILKHHISLWVSFMHKNQWLHNRQPHPPPKIGIIVLLLLHAVEQWPGRIEWDIANRFTGVLVKVSAVRVYTCAERVISLVSMCEPVADPGFLKGGFSFSLTKTSAQFELKTKKKVINLHTSLSVVFYIYYWMISNKTTVIRASQSDCSIRESRSDCHSIRVYEF